MAGWRQPGYVTSSCILWHHRCVTLLYQIPLLIFNSRKAAKFIKPQIEIHFHLCSLAPLRANTRFDKS